MSFWGLFGGVNVPMPMWIYAVLNAVLIISVIGFVFFFLRLLLAEWRTFRAEREPWLARLLRPVERNFGLIVNLVFSAAIVYGLIQWPPRRGPRRGGWSSRPFRRYLH